MAASKSIIAVGVIALLAAAGWYGWQNYGDMLLGNTSKMAQTPAAAKPAPPPSGAPAAGSAKMNGAQPGGAASAPSSSSDKIIDDLLAASGYKHMASSLPQQIIDGAANARAAKGRPPVNSFELEAMLKESFTTKGFYDRGVAEVRKNFDEKRVKAALEMVSTPLAKRMTEMEKAQPSAADVTEFAAKAPTPQRLALITKLDKASKSSELVGDISFAAAHALAAAAAGSDAAKRAKVDADIAQARSQGAETLRNNVLGSLAIVYRKASDADLTDYIKLLESDNGKWLTATLSRAVLEEIKAGSTRLGERIAAGNQGKPAVAGAKAPDGKAAGAEAKTPDAAKTAAKPAPEPMVKKEATAPVEDKPVRTAGASSNRQGSRSGEDSRECLDLPTNVEIIKCAEQFR